MVATDGLPETQLVTLRILTEGCEHYDLPEGVLGIANNEIADPLRKPLRIPLRIPLRTLYGHLYGPLSGHLYGHLYGQTPHTYL